MTFCHTFPIHTNGNVVFRWNRQDSIRNTFQRKQDTFDAEEQRKSDENQRGPGRNVVGWYPPIPIRRNPMGSMGIQRSPSMSIGITGLVINLISDKCSIKQICLVLKAMKRNSSFQVRMTRTYSLFFKPLSKTALYANKYSMHEMWPVIQAMQLKGSFQAWTTKNTPRIFT